MDDELEPFHSDPLRHICWFIGDPANDMLDKDGSYSLHSTVTQLPRPTPSTSTPAGLN